MTLSKRWIVSPSAPIDLLAQYRGISPILAQVLYNRGFTDPQSADRFLFKQRGDSADFSPFKMADMSKAVARVRQAITRDEPIAVYGDFDADGVTSTALMVQALRTLGARVQPYIPRRIEEGYGLNTPALLELKKSGIKLVITVDCGIRSVEEIRDANSAGLDVIITDHHSLGPELPEAYAVVNCKREGYPEDMLAGVGVAYKFAEALANAQSKNGSRRGKPLELESLLDLVAIGTVADIMPLNRLENRILVSRGLEVLNKGGRVGIRALLDIAGIQGAINTGTIGFAIGPRINAAGRLDDAMIAYRLLVAHTQEEANAWAQKLQDLNLRRQDITRTAQDKIRQRLDPSNSYHLIFESDPSFEPGIVGLVAGRITEEFFVPSVILEEGESESRASCRSIPQFDITAALDNCADLLVRHGGHALAAGFTVLNENIPALKNRLSEIAQTALHGQELAPTITVDAVLKQSQITEELINELNLLEPTGSGNRPPTFALMGVSLAEARTVGQDNRHLKLKIYQENRAPLDAIGFNLGDLANTIQDRLVDVAFQLEINEWNGRKTLQLRLVDARPTMEQA